MEETGGPGENHRPATSHWQTLSHNVVNSPLMIAMVLNGTHWFLFRSAIGRQ